MSYPVVNFNVFLPLDEATNDHVDVQDDHFEIVRQICALAAPCCSRITACSR